MATPRQHWGMWNSAADFEDIRYEKTEDGAIAKITINRPEVRNAFRPLTVNELPGLMLSSTCSAGNSGTTEGSAGKLNIDLDCWVSP